MQIDEDEDNRNTMLQAASNIIFKYQSKRDNFTFLKQYLSKNDVSHDLDLLIPWHSLNIWYL